MREEKGRRFELREIMDADEGAFHYCGEEGEKRGEESRVVGEEESKEREKKKKIHKGKDRLDFIDFLWG